MRGKQRTSAAADPLKSLQSRIAVRTSWANTADPAARTAPARAAGPGSLEWHAKRLDPEGKLDPAERMRRAEHAKRAYFLRLALRSAASRARATADDAGGAAR